MNCPFCGKGRVKRETRVLPFSYRGTTIEVNTPSEWCDKCGEGLLSRADAAKVVKILRDEMPRIDNTSSDKGEKR